MSKLETNTIDNISGSTTLTIGDSNTSTIALKSGATLTNFPDNTPAFQVRKSGGQTISHATATTVTFDTEDVDTDSAFASNTFTVPSGKNGNYFIFAQIRWEGSADFEGIRLTIRKNSSNHFSTWGRQEYYQNQYVGGIISLGVGDTVDVQCRQSSGGDVNLGHNDSGTITFFGGYKLL